jgi:hypothetical protein
VSDIRIVYTPHPDATAEGELDALATVYRYLIANSNVTKKATGTGSGEDKEGDLKSDSRADGRTSH